MTSEITPEMIEDGYQMSWSEVAELTHAEQVRLFGWCSCEDGTPAFDDCTGEVTE